MESGPGDVAAGGAFADKKLRDEQVEIPSYVEPPVAGLSSRQKFLYHGSGIAVGILISALGFAAWRYVAPDTAEIARPPIAPQLPLSSAPPETSAPANASNAANPVTTQVEAPPHPRAHHAKANAGADVIAAAKPATGIMYVHRNNSDLRPAPSTSSEPIKKLAKGEKVQLLMLSDKWAQVDDAGTKGWMRASVLKDTPPGEKKSRRKKADVE
jgi:hypothetical protein